MQKWNTNGWLRAWAQSSFLFFLFSRHLVSTYLPGALLGDEEAVLYQEVEWLTTQSDPSLFPTVHTTVAPQNRVGKPQSASTVKGAHLLGDYLTFTSSCNPSLLIKIQISTFYLFLSQTWSMAAAICITLCPGKHPIFFPPSLLASYVWLVPYSTPHPPTPTLLPPGWWFSHGSVLFFWLDLWVFFFFFEGKGCIFCFHFTVGSAV